MADPLLSSPKPGDPPNPLELFSVQCPEGDQENPLDTYHVLDFHVGAPVRVNCHLDSRERQGMQHQGEFSVLPAGITGRWVMEAPADALILRISPSLVAQTADALRLKGSRTEIIPAIGVRDPHLEHIVGLLRAERQATDFHGRLFTDDLSVAIAARLLLRYGASHGSARSFKHKLPKWRLRHVCDYIDAHLDHDLSLTDLAGVAGFSVPHFKVLFHGAVGMSPHRYVVERRVERARQLLLEGTQTMGDIALEAGFTHRSHMARCVRRVLGISPVDLVALGKRRGL